MGVFVGTEGKEGSEPFAAAEREAVQCSPRCLAEPAMPDAPKYVLVGSLSYSCEFLRRARWHGAISITGVRAVLHTSG